MNENRTAKTIDFKGRQYAQVKDRLKEFRQDNPNALVETTPIFQEDGSLMFKARLLKDKADPASAEATGHAYAKQEKVDNEKGFEKLETIAVGRALALIGYGSDGEIASSDEMEEFIAYQESQKLESVMAWTEKMTDAKTLAELAAIWPDVPAELKVELQALKEEMKQRLAPKKPKAAPPITAATQDNTDTHEGT